MRKKAKQMAILCIQSTSERQMIALHTPGFTSKLLSTSGSRNGPKLTLAVKENDSNKKFARQGNFLLQSSSSALPMLDWILKSCQTFCSLCCTCLGKNCSVTSPLWTNNSHKNPGTVTFPTFCVYAYVYPCMCTCEPLDAYGSQKVMCKLTPCTMSVAEIRLWNL